MKEIRVILNSEQRKVLERFSKTGTHSARLITRAKIILLLDISENRPDVTLAEIAQHLDVSIQTIQNVRRDFLASGDAKGFLLRKKRDTPPIEPKVTGDVEARIIALACGQPPPGCARWTLQLLADKSVELKLVDSLSSMTVGRLLKKHSLSLT